MIDFATTEHEESLLMQLDELQATLEGKEDTLGDLMGHSQKLAEGVLEYLGQVGFKATREWDLEKLADNVLRSVEGY